MEKNLEFKFGKVFIIFAILFACSIPLVLWIAMIRQLNILGSIDLFIMDSVFLFCLSITGTHITYIRYMLKEDNFIEIGEGTKLQMFMVIIIVGAYIIYVVNGIYGANIMFSFPIAVAVFLIETIIGSNITLIGDKFIIRGTRTIQIDFVKSWDVFEKSNIIRLNFKDGRVLEIMISSKVKEALLQKILK